LGIRREGKEGFKRLQNRFETRFQKLDLLPQNNFKGLQIFWFSLNSQIRKEGRVCFITHTSKVKTDFIPNKF
jgi:hypothetical protein